MKKWISIFALILAVYFGAILALLLASYAFAADKKTPTLDFTQEITDLDGKPVPSGNVKEPNLTLGAVAVNALENMLEEDRQQSGEAKFKNDELARKVYKSKAAVLTVEEIALIKARIGKTYGALVVGAAWRLLDPSVKKENTK